MNKIKEFFSKFFRSVRLVYQNFSADHGFLMASNLGYITFLGFIPFVMVIFYFTPNITMGKIREVILGFIFQTFLPGSAESLKQIITEMLERRLGMNIFGFILLMMTSFFLFKSISRAFDDILRIHKLKERNFFRDFERFIAAIVGGVIIVAMLLFTTSLPIISTVANLKIIIHILPYFSIFLLLFVMFKFIPSVRPKASHSAIGAVFTSIVWIISKISFDWYIVTFTNVKSVYGTLGAFPIFMIWLYLNWVTILFGMEVVSFHTNVKHPRKRKKVQEEGVRIKLRIEKICKSRPPKKIKEFQTSDYKDNKEELRKILNFLIDEKNK
ncbi:MAG: YihY/virulence factor BrkB family protein [Candidatus Cloacimonadota bacterium]|nr:YihY/virulence factor BrkB family protein [Candidatus Cloacimonadota bacterium]